MEAEEETQEDFTEDDIHCDEGAAEAEDECHEEERAEEEEFEEMFELMESRGGSTQANKQSVICSFDPPISFHVDANQRQNADRVHTPS